MTIQAPLRLGQLLAGTYRIEEPMTAGGFAVLFRGVRETDGHEVCIKALRMDSTAEDPAAVQRFLREAAIATQLRHPHLVRVHDVGITRDDMLYMVMDLLHGESLDRVIYRRALPPLRVRNLLVQLLDALALVHREKLVHRDLKPSNLFLCRGPCCVEPEIAATPAPPPPAVDDLKVLDFGVAKGLRHSDTAMRADLTGDGIRVGTPGYMAPELARPNVPVTQLMDLYAAGVIGYEMLTGRYAFPGTGWARFAAMIDGDPPPPPAPLDTHPLYAVIQRLMARRAVDRYPTADAALRDLDDLSPDDVVLWP